MLGELGPELVSHSSDHGDLDRFRGKDVTVIGGGQAALETAALLAEQGTRVRVIARAGGLRWNDVPPPWDRPWWQSARAPHSGLGCGWRNWFYAERPDAFRALPSPPAPASPPRHWAPRAPGGSATGSNRPSSCCWATRSRLRVTGARAPYASKHVGRSGE